MSIVLNGELHQLESLVRLLHNYKALCTKEEAKQNVDTSKLTIVNKYYSAQLTLTSVGFDADGDGSVLDNAEGYVLVVDGADNDLSLPKYDLSKAAIENDTGLRLLVTMTAGAEAVHRRVYEEWALENGFEFIEIDTTDPTKDHEEREKCGLPRLVEALESNMWSTMQRAPRTAPPSSSSSAATNAVGAGSLSSASTADVADVTSSYTPPTLPIGTVESLPVPPAATATPAPTESNTSAPSAAPPASTAESEGKAGVDPFELEMEDKEDNEIVDKYANFITEVKSFREQATAGQITDQARRDQAAEMALRLAQMMGFDESDSDDSS